MKIHSIEKQNRRLATYVEFHKSKKKELMGIVRTVRDEDRKPEIERYLLVPKQWYEDHQLHLGYLLFWSEKRIKSIINKLYENVRN